MLRLIFRSAGPALETFLGRYNHVLRKSPSKCIPLRYILSCSDRELVVLLKQKERTVSNDFPLKNYSGIVLLGGLFGFLNLPWEEADSEDSELKKILKLAIVKTQRGSYAEAETLLYDALKYAHKTKNEDGILYVSDLLANLMFETKRNDNAAVLFVDVLHRLFAKGTAADDNKVLHIGLKLSMIDEKRGKFIDAEMGYKYVMENLEKKVESLNVKDKDTLQLQIVTLDSYARFLVRRQRPSEAMPFFQKAYQLSVDLNGKKNEEAALILSDMGSVANLLGDIDGAIKYTEEAISIGRTLEEEIKHSSLIYYNLANLYMMKEMYEEANEACLSGINDAKRSSNEEMLKQGKKYLQEIKALKEKKNENKEILIS